MSKKAKTEGNVHGQLTSDDLDLQRRRGMYFRKLIRESCSDFVDAIPRNARNSEVGIMLSGGFDSTSILWSLLELGVKPRVYTFSIDGLGVDAQKAIQLADHYGLKYEVVHLKKDPELVVADLIHVHEVGEGKMTSRPDHEVLAMFLQIGRHAKNDGVKYIFSGIGDNAIHLHGRKSEVRCRSGFTSTHETNLRRAEAAGDQQSIVLTQLFHDDLGMYLCLPLFGPTIAQPYHDVSWHVMNNPGMKRISIRAFEAEERACGVKIVPKPMQTGDAGSREYFDKLVPQSIKAQSLVGKHMNTALPLYNALNKADGFERGNSVDWSWVAHVSSTAPLHKDSYRFADEHTGRAELPEESTENLFGDILGEGEEVVVLDENGEPDTRVDCLGNAFYSGNAETSCGRAAAGLCGKYEPDVPLVSEECTYWSKWANVGSDRLNQIGEKTSGEIARVYGKWAIRTASILNEIEKRKHRFN